MYLFKKAIQRDAGCSVIPDIEFSPDDSMFSATYQNGNEFRIFDTASLDLIRVYKNPEALLDWPHGLAFTNQHIIVANKHETQDKPCTFTVYNLKTSSIAPIFVFPTPVEYLREGHSMVYLGKRLYVTYSSAGPCGIATYDFDDDTGTISGPTSIAESWFNKNATPKGICFNANKNRLLVTLTWLDKNGSNPYLVLDSGLAEFDVDHRGVLSEEPVKLLRGAQFSRPENISIANVRYTIANAHNNSINVYHIGDKDFPGEIEQVIKRKISFPHDACLSQDGKLLIVANCGVKVVGDTIKWGSYYKPRRDKLIVFEYKENINFVQKWYYSTL